MPRTQIELTDEQARRLEEVAATSGRSVTDVILESVDVYLGKESPSNRPLIKERARNASGKFRSSVKDLGSNHDCYLAEDLDE